MLTNSKRHDELHKTKPQKQIMKFMKENIVYRQLVIIAQSPKNFSGPVLMEHGTNTGMMEFMEVPCLTIYNKCNYKTQSNDTTRRRL